MAKVAKWSKTLVCSVDVFVSMDLSLEVDASRYMSHALRISFPITWQQSKRAVCRNSMCHHVGNPCASASLMKTVRVTRGNPSPASELLNFSVNSAQQRFNTVLTVLTTLWAGQKWSSCYTTPAPNVAFEVIWIVFLSKRSSGLYCLLAKTPSKLLKEEYWTGYCSLFEVLSYTSIYTYSCLKEYLTGNAQHFPLESGTRDTTFSCLFNRVLHTSNNSFCPKKYPTLSKRNAKHVERLYASSSVQFSKNPHTLSKDVVLHLLTIVGSAVKS